MGTGGGGKSIGTGGGWCRIGDKVGSVWGRRGRDELLPGRGAAASRPREVERLLCLESVSRAAEVARAALSSFMSRIASFVVMCTNFASLT